MPEQTFNNFVPDSQETIVEPVAPEKFNFARYVDYESALLDKNREFWTAQQGVAVHRRFRVPQVYTYGCRDMVSSLALQLGALQESMKFPADIPNFLEPWYGIGTVSSAFRGEYQWEPEQAPAIKPPFVSIDEALNAPVIPVEETPIGRHTLQMIEYFLEQTQGRLPMSLTDTQSPMNIASFLLETNAFYMSFYDNPEGLQQLLDRITQQIIYFTQKQIELIGDALVYPGHGFACSRCFSGLGMSDDVMITLAPEQYRVWEIPALQKAGEPFGGVAFHSCGNWSAKTQAVRDIANLVMVDGAFTSQTDPDCNAIPPFVDTFRHTGIVLNARMVGSPDVVQEKLQQLWKEGMKIIVVTYGQTPHEQKDMYVVFIRFPGDCDSEVRSRFRIWRKFYTIWRFIRFFLPR